MTDTATLLALYRAMYTARMLDRAQADLIRRGEAFFHIPGEGHESSAAVGPHLTAGDCLACHYRDKALLLFRGVPLLSFFSTQLCRAGGPSGGRQLPDILSDPAHNVLSIPVPVGNHALHAVGMAAAIRDRAACPVVLCAVGDGTTQQGEFLEACGEAVRWRLPVLFLVEDNRWAISTPTAERTFFSLPEGEPDQFLGMPIHRSDGSDTVAAHELFGAVIAQMRQDHKPAVVLLSVERLASHSNADDQSFYRPERELESARMLKDPVKLLGTLLRQRCADERVLSRLEQDALDAVAAAEAEASRAPEPLAVLSAKKPLSPSLTDPAAEYRGSRGGQRLTMREAIREVLRHHLAHDPRVFLYGQDIEDPKGDVFGVTKGLSTEFPSRVRNAPLSESTIIGVCIGRALAGGRPVAFLQFADFLPLAYNQLVSELGSMYWRTVGGWQCPVIVMVSCGGYSPGLGPFHTQTFESVAAHIPGIDVLMPADAADAAGLLHAAFASGRPTVFLYPKSCLNLAGRTTSTDVARQFVPLGVARIIQTGKDMTLVAWGNSVALCEKAAEALRAAGVEAEILDLRSLSPWDEGAVLRSAQKTRRLLVVHEDNRTCGFGAEVVATVAERSSLPIACRRLTRPDTWIPCNFRNQLEVLPSFRGLVETAADLLGLEVVWHAPPGVMPDTCLVAARGSGPSDEAVRVVRLCVEVGAAVVRGQLLAEIEASKATHEIQAPVSGTVQVIFAREGDVVEVGQPILAIHSQSQEIGRKPVVQEEHGTPVFLRRAPPKSRRTEDDRPLRPDARRVGIVSLAAVPGGRAVPNAELLGRHHGKTDSDVVRRTGIQSRRWVAEQEDAVQLAVRAARAALAEAGVDIQDIDLIVCSSGTPTMATPSLACRILAELAAGRRGVTLPAYDINAACSGYLYALLAAYDHVQANLSSQVLVVTAEVLSPLLNLDDFNTTFLFGDAASATVVVGEEGFDRARAHLYRPEVSARGESGEVVSVPLPRQGSFIQMKGTQVFPEAVRAMTASLRRACNVVGIPPEELAIVVPHQANQRIIDAVHARINRPVYSNIRQFGNTSSSSIPLALVEVLAGSRPGDHIGLCAFGGGFTFGAAILQSLLLSGEPAVSERARVSVPG